MAAAAWLAGLGLASCAHAPDGDPPGIEQFSQIDGDRGVAGARIGFGGATPPEALPGLKRRGYRTLINLRLVDEKGVDLEACRAAAQAAGIQYVHLPFDTDRPVPDVVPPFIAAVADPAHQPVYVHCNSATRAAALWMITRVLKDGWTLEAASAEARRIAKSPDEAIAYATRYLAAQKTRNP